MTLVPKIRTLVLDLETRPNLAYTWGLWDQRIGLNQLVESGSVICWAAKFVGEKKVHFSSIRDGHDVMMARIYELVNEADAVVHFNGKRFDMPHLRTEWCRLDLSPPSPYHEIDLYQVAKQQFRFTSNKLEYIAQELLGEGKVQNGGFQLWVDCLANDDKAWKLMRKYNEADVTLTERLYERLKPWIKNMPNPALYGTAEEGEHTCPACGSAEVKKEGFAYTSTRKYQRYTCYDCGKWSRDTRSVEGSRLV